MDVERAPRGLTGRNLIVAGNDFVEADQGATILIVAEDHKAACLLLNDPLERAGKTYRYMVASPRFTKDDFRVLSSAGRLGCNVTWVPDDRFDPDNPMDLSWWRGGAAAIADMSLK